MKWFRTVTFLLMGVCLPFLALGTLRACRNSQGRSHAVGRLRVGDPAPMLRFEAWIKGDRVERFEPGRIYVLEFWATWCPPCREVIPHLTELARLHRERVTFIGVNVWEKSTFGNVKSKVEGFVNEMGPRMDYAVAMDSADDYMANQWLRAAGRNGIPAAVVVDGSGKIAWIGHPMDGLDAYLQGMVGKP